MTSIRRTSAAGSAALVAASWIIERVRKVIIGDGTLRIELKDGTTLDRSIERVRHGNDAKLVIGDVQPAAGPGVDSQLIIVLRDAHRARALALTKSKLSLDQLAIKFGRSTER